MEGFYEKRTVLLACLSPQIKDSRFLSICRGEPVYETKLDKGGRVIWEVAVDYSKTSVDRKHNKT